MRRASFNEKSSRGSITSDESRKRLSKILPPWCQQPSPQSPITEANTNTNGEESKTTDNAKKKDDTGVSKRISKDRCDSAKNAFTSQEETVKSEKSSRTRELKKDKWGEKDGTSSPSYEMSGDGVDGVTVFLMEKFATHQQIDKYTQEYNSLVFHITLCLV